MPRFFLLIATSIMLAGLCCVADVRAQPAPPPDGVAGTFGPAYGAPEQVPSLSKELGITLPATLPQLTLPRLDNQALIIEDGAWVTGGKPVRYGVEQLVDGDGLAAASRWFDGPNGTSLWIVELRSPEAVGIRVHLGSVDLPDGARAVVYAPEAPGAAQGPYTGRGVLDTGSVWAPTIFGETVRIELLLPKGTERQLPFTLDRIHRIYRNLRDIDPSQAEVGNCHNDVTCYPAWANTAKACGGIGFISGASSLYCSGTMLNTTAADQTPYWLTANHCISGESTANTSEIYWLYQTPTCNSSAPALAGVPQSSVCTVVSQNGATDHCLLLIKGALPAGLYFAGWSPSRPSANQQLVGIHHPDGSWKRISFSTFGGTGTYSSASSVRSNWTSGVTEPGSSGSGLFKADTQQIVGQLFGGPSACGVAAGSLYDWYGDFSLTLANYPTVSTALAAGSDDASAPNQTCSTARALSGASGTLAGRIVKSTAEDWYSIAVPAGATATVSLANITNAYGNVDLQLYTACAGSPAASSTGTGTTESAAYTNSSASAVTIFARVYLSTSVRNTYDVSWSVAGVPTTPANDSCASATVITSAGGTFIGTTATATIDGALSSCAGTANSKDVWYQFTAPAAGTLTLNTCTSAFDTVLSVLQACGGTQIVCNDDAAAGVGPCGGTTQSYLSTVLTSGQNVKIRVSGYNGASGTFSLTAAWAPSGPTAPANDTCAGALAIANGTTPFDTTNATSDATTDVGCNFSSFNGFNKDLWYRHVASCTGTVSVDTCGTTGFDSKIGVYSACPTGNNQVISCNDDVATCSTGGALRSKVTFNAVASTPYLIRIGGFTGASGPGTLTISCTASSTSCSVADIAPTGGPDGVVDGSDFVTFINSFAIGDVAVDPAADINADGIIDGSDFVSFINAFALGC